MTKFTRLRFLLNTDGDSVHYLDLARELSKVERRLHPQFRNYTVLGGIMKDSNQDAVARFNVAPDVWPVRTALRRGKRIFDKMVNQRVKELGMDVKPKYHDFKVMLNSSSTTFEQTVDAGGNVIAGGEWVYPRYVSEDVKWDDTELGGASSPAGNRNADEFSAFICGGDHIAGSSGGGQDVWARIGLVKSWIETRAEPEDDLPNLPTTITTDPLANLFDESDADDEVLMNLNHHNDEAPYDEDTCYGMQYGSVSGTGENLQRVSLAACQAGAGQIASIPGFTALCGLVQISLTGTEPGTATPKAGVVEIILDVVGKGEKI
jgi:hypothetical protein